MLYPTYQDDKLHLIPPNRAIEPLRQLRNAIPTPRNHRQRRNRKRPDEKPKPLALP